MQIVIDIPQSAYEAIQMCKSIENNNDGNLGNVLQIAVENGVVLPEHHGRIIDAEELAGLIYDVGVIRAFNKVSTILESSYHGKYDLQDYEVCALQQAELCIALLTNIKNICECVRREEE